jgi:hypothetical protein
VEEEEEEEEEDEMMVVMMMMMMMMTFQVAYNFFDYDGFQFHHMFMRRPTV